MDVSGVETDSVSAHIVTRAGKNRGRFVKLSVVGSNLTARKERTLIHEAALKVPSSAARV